MAGIALPPRGAAARLGGVESFGFYSPQDRKSLQNLEQGSDKIPCPPGYLPGLRITCRHVSPPIYSALV